MHITILQRFTFSRVGIPGRYTQSHSSPNDRRKLRDVSQELALRSAILYIGQLMSNAFGAVQIFDQPHTVHSWICGHVQLIAAGILANMEGKRGIQAWRWCVNVIGAVRCGSNH